MSIGQQQWMWIGLGLFGAVGFIALLKKKRARKAQAPS